MAWRGVVKCRREIQREANADAKCQREIQPNADAKWRGRMASRNPEARRTGRREAGGRQGRAEAGRGHWR